MRQQGRAALWPAERGHDQLEVAAAAATGLRQRRRSMALLRGTLADAAWRPVHPLLHDVVRRLSREQRNTDCEAELLLVARRLRHRVRCGARHRRGPARFNLYPPGDTHVVATHRLQQPPGHL